MKYDVVGFGACGVDLTFQVPELPKNNKKILARDLTVAGGGVTANNLVQCAKLDLRTAWIGVLGNDGWSDYSRQLLKKQGVIVPLNIKAATPTGQFYIFNDPVGANCMVGLPLAPEYITPRLVTEKFTSIIKSARCLHLEIAVISLAATYRAAQIAKKAGVRVLVDIDMFPEQPKDIAYFYKILKLSDAVKTNAGLYRHLRQPNAITALRKLFSFGPRLVVTTLGPQGCLAYDGIKIWRINGLRVKARDTAGAGDAFMGGLSYGFLKTWPTDKILNFANACGAYKCGQPGTRSSGSLRDIMKFLKE